MGVVALDRREGVGHMCMGAIRKCSPELNVTGQPSVDFIALNQIGNGCDSVQRVPMIRILVVGSWRIQPVMATLNSPTIQRKPPLVSSTLAFYEGGR